jgi:signal transduction histidine kinase
MTNPVVQLQKKAAHGARRRPKWHGVPRREAELLTTMSHELRAPLNAILGFTTVLLQQMAGPLNAEQVKQLETVLHCARHLSGLIDDMLDLSKINSGNLKLAVKAFDLSASIANVMAIVKPLAAAKGLSLRLELPRSLRQLVSDQRRVEQILINLLHNAIKFTETGEVKLIGEIANKHGSGPGSEDESFLRLCIIDSGIGIKAADLATLFEPFRQLGPQSGRQYDGSGLGLSICRRLAALLNGDIEVQSRYGSGSQFTLSLPLKRGAAS